MICWVTCPPVPVSRTAYCGRFGGDRHIPELTYQQFKAFHDGLPSSNGRIFMAMTTL
jgi:hypothetical protein